MFRLLSKPSAKLFSKLIVLFYLFTSIICGFWFFQMLANSIPRSLNPCLFQSLSCVQLFVTPWTAACRAALFFTISRSLLKLVSIESVMPSDHLILCRHLLLPSVFPSIRIFSSELALCIRCFSFSISPSNEYSGLISLRIDWFGLLAVQGTLRSLL